MKKLSGNESIRSRFVAATMAAVLLTGCMTDPRIRTEPKKLAAIKTIALVLPPEDKYAYFSAGNMKGPVVVPIPAVALLGVVVVAALISKATGAPEARAQKLLDDQARLAKLIQKDDSAPITTALANRTVDRLRLRGFDARIEQGSWERREDGTNHLALESLKTDADAILVVDSKIMGFVSDPIFVKKEDPTALVATPANMERVDVYKPTIWVIATVHERDGAGKFAEEKLLYRGYHAVGWDPKEGREPIRDYWNIVPMPSSHTFETLDEAESTREQTFDALKKAAEAIATSIVEDIGRQ